VLLFALTAATSSAYGAAGGVLRGHVTDSGNHILPGATIHVEPGGVTVVSDREGNFVIPDLAAGTYKIDIAYVGFLSETREVSVSRTPVVLDVKLNLAPTVSESVTTEARAVRQLDMSLQKAFNVVRSDVALVVEAFNLTNHQNVTAVTRTVANHGSPTAFDLSRTLQIGVKVDF
jgi:hypothetical protein